MNGATSLLLLAGAAPWTPLAKASLFWHSDLSQKTIVDDGRDEVDAWPDQGASGVVAVPITYPADGLNGAILRPPLVADAGDGKPAIDGSDATIGRGLRAPFTAEQLAWMHDGVSAYSIGTNLFLSAGETLSSVLLSTGGYTGTNAGICLWLSKFAGGWKVVVSMADGTSAVNALETVISAPQNAHLWLVVDQAQAKPLKLWLNGVQVDEWTGTLPAGAGAGSGYGLCFGNWARSVAYFGSAWKGRFVSIYREAITAQADIEAHAEWAAAEGYLG